MMDRNLYLVAIPDKSIVEIITAIRKEAVELGYSKPDPRTNALPHITLTYIEEGNLTPTQTDLIISKLNELKTHKPTPLFIKEITNWENKVITLFDTKPLKKLVTQSQKLFESTKIIVNRTYIKINGNTVGDHMKIIRQIYPEKIPLAKKCVKQKLPKLITLERIAFIRYDCTEKDIIWQKKLTF